MQTKESVERQYELLKELYGIQSSGWSMLHERFNRYVFCEANRKSLIAEYLMWEEMLRNFLMLHPYTSTPHILDMYLNKIIY